MAALHFKIVGGILTIISAYAPHNGYDVDEKSDFFKSLKEFYIRVKSHGPTIIAGDFNARLHRRRSHEIDVLGNYIFGDRNVHIDDVTSNRHLLIEM